MKEIDVEIEAGKYPDVSEIVSEQKSGKGEE